MNDMGMCMIMLSTGLSKNIGRKTTQMASKNGETPEIDHHAHAPPFSPPQPTTHTTQPTDTQQRMPHVAKKLINAPEDVVEEALQGLLLAHPSLARLEGPHHVVLRMDAAAVKDTQVALISGGGSGHEPAHAGYVGAGMLTAAVCGGVFASPSGRWMDGWTDTWVGGWMSSFSLPLNHPPTHPPTVASILSAIRAVTGRKGCLLIVKRYTGDLLNFGMAREQALSEGLEVEMVVVGDDCALPKAKGITGRRGVAGTVLVHKVAGAAAAAGLALDLVKAEAEQVIASMGSLGVALSVCTVPGSTPSDRLDGETIELGMGIHGEQGIKRMPMSSANAVVDQMLNAIMGDESQGGHGYLPLAPNQDVVLLVNNLCATPALELSIVARRAVQVLEDKATIQARVHRVFVGPFMTSFEMAGVSLTILKVDAALLTRLDAPTTVPGWLPAEPRVPLSTGHVVPVPALPATPAAVAAASSSSKLAPDVWAQYSLSAQAAAETLLQAKDRLNELDAIGGDGDCGGTLERGAKAVLLLVSPSAAVPQDAPAFLVAVAAAISDSMGGTSGAFLEILFRAMARSLQQQQQQAGNATPSENQWAAALQHGVERMAFYGGARPGYRTMLDAWLPVSAALVSGQGLAGAAHAARTGADSTKRMEAMAGRANYVPAEVTQGHPDPGAEAVALVFEALCTTTASA